MPDERGLQPKQAAEPGIHHSHHFWGPGAPRALPFQAPCSSQGLDLTLGSTCPCRTTWWHGDKINEVPRAWARVLCHPGDRCYIEVMKERLGAKL